jgi:hypothetical protein
VELLLAHWCLAACDQPELLGQDARMAQFHLHVECQERVYEDVEGQEFTNIEGARAEAAEIARELVSHSLRDDGSLGLNRSVLIFTREGALIERISFRAALEQAPAG